ncbi:MAG: polysaccharide biosynthesis/export family protein [Pseudomonadota bacterium]
MRLRNISGQASRAMLVLALGACAASKSPMNRADVEEGQAYQAEYRSITHDRSAMIGGSYQINRDKCFSDPNLIVAPKSRATDTLFNGDGLSPGDLVEIDVAGDDLFDGSFQIDQQGYLRPPFLEPIKASGRAPAELQAIMAANLLKERFFRGKPPRVSIRLRDYGVSQVHVAGAVWSAGAFDLNFKTTEIRDNLRQDSLGDATNGRGVVNAIASAGGARPDADLANVQIRRNGELYSVDLRNAARGRAYENLMMAPGDEVFVPSRSCFQKELAKPTPITRPGIKVFMSNLTIPADSNSESAIGISARELRYGTTFIQAVAGMNCYGGTQLTNADRYAVLFSRDPITGESVVIQRRIEELLRNANRDEFNPIMLPDDALACYDSWATNVRDVATTLGILLAPAIVNQL